MGVTGPKPLSRQRSPWRETAPPPIPGAVNLRAWVRDVHDGQLRAFTAIEDGRWHLSISHARLTKGKTVPGRYPSWDEIAHARYELLPGDLTFAMLLPPLEEYVAVHPTTFHLHEIDG